MKLVTLEQIFSKLKRKSSYDPINRKETGMSKLEPNDITINKKNRSFYVSGWYDGCVGIQGAEIKLDDFIKLFNGDKR
jgi:hypothetical protein